LLEDYFAATMGSDGLFARFRLDPRSPEGRQPATSASASAGVGRTLPCSSKP